MSRVDECDYTQSLISVDSKVNPAQQILNRPHIINLHQDSMYALVHSHTHAEQIYGHLDTGPIDSIIQSFHSLNRSLQAKHSPMGRHFPFPAATLWLIPSSWTGYSPIFLQALSDRYPPKALRSPPRDATPKTTMLGRRTRFPSHRLALATLNIFWRGSEERWGRARWS